MLDADSCYRAIRARDPRFDGRFFTGVLTTGIYCRPVCPARTPRKENVRFFERAAAAEEAGFRPCRRCRPETALGSPAWHGASSTVARALKRIADGALDGQSVEVLAERLGIGSRQLRRLFSAHVGATPRSLAQTRRVHFARLLLDETRLPITEIAHASGFASVRRFNSAFLHTFGAPPRELRGSAGSAPAGSRNGIELRLPFRPPLDWDCLLSFLARRAIEGVEEVRDGTYRRTVEGEGFQGSIEVLRAPEGTALVLRAPAAASKLLFSIVRRTRGLFDLDCDPRQIREHLGRDATLAGILRSHEGIRVPGAWDGFEISVRAILGQQISVAGATTLAGRLANRFGEPLAGGPGLSRLFPRPEALKGARLSRIGIAESRARSIRSLACAVLDDGLVLDGTEEPETTRGRLERIPGIGPWTAQYISMRALRDPDAFLAEDLWIRRALARGKVVPSASAVRERSRSWRPWRSYAVMALWSLDTERPNRRRTGDATRIRTV